MRHKKSRPDAKHGTAKTSAAAKRLRTVRDGLRRCLDRLSALLESHKLERPLKPGDEVYVVKLHKWGTVERLTSHGQRARVLVGEREIDVEVSELQPWGHDV